ncbi:hypothetical protein [Methylomonas sp. AM2-LC]|uniref:hypothetical protein n=1 Tax=Methylomonas sp. AM2-LC TaxID=3153301 RepID=UPI00326578C6
MKNPFFIFLMGYIAAPCLMLASSIIFGDAITVYIYTATLVMLFIAAIVYASIRKS